MPRRFFLNLLSSVIPAGDHVPDAELLRRFAHDRDPAAFELLARRHADAVWTACRRVLRSEADADDAFQATFLVLARKAGSVRGVCAAGWLYHVAVTAALKLKASRERERPEEFKLRSLPARQTPDSLETNEFAAVIHEELARLPDRYRLPVVLCDLEGHTHAAAAAALNWPVGSVSGRLSRARAILRDRLTRRGISAPAVLVPILGLHSSVVRNATAAASGAAAMPPSVPSLAQGVLSAMRTAKLKLTALVLAASAGLLGLVGAAAVAVMGQPAGQVDVADTQPELPSSSTAPVPQERPIEGDWLGGAVTAFPELKLPEKAADRDLSKMCPRLFAENAIKIEASDDTYRRLLKARLQQCIFFISHCHKQIAIGQYREDDFWAMVRVQEDMQAVSLELWGSDPMNLLPRLEELVIVAKNLERFIKARVQAGTDVPKQLDAAKRFRLATEAALWKAKHSKAGGK